MPITLLVVAPPGGHELLECLFYPLSMVVMVPTMATTGDKALKLNSTGTETAF